MNQENKSVNIGVVGFGSRSRSVLKRLLPQDSRLRLKGVYDTNPAAVERAKHELSLKDVHAYQSLAALVEDPAIDCVIVGLGPEIFASLPAPSAGDRRRTTWGTDLL